MDIVKKERDRVHGEVKSLLEETIEFKEQVHVMRLGLGMGWNWMWVGDRIELIETYFRDGHCEERERVQEEVKSLQEEMIERKEQVHVMR